MALYIISEKNSKAAFRGKVYRLQEKIPSWLPSGKRRIDSEKRKKKIQAGINQILLHGVLILYEGANLSACIPLLKAECERKAPYLL